MKTIRFIGIICLMMLSISACKKSEVKPEQDQFDIDNLLDYYIVIKHFEQNNSTHATPHLIQFFGNPNKSIGFNDWHYEKVQQGLDVGVLRIGSMQYENNTFHFNKNLLSGFSLLYKGGELKSIESPDKLQAKLIKIPASNSFAGKTFIGKYYKEDGSVLHETFFYQFAEDSNRLSAGLVYPTVLRTNDFKMDHPAMGSGKYNEDRELLIYDGEKLLASYYDKANYKIYYGEFVEQK